MFIKEKHNDQKLVLNGLTFTENAIIYLLF